MKDSIRRPHIHVLGDLAELELVKTFSTPPDHDDPGLAVYRRVTGQLKRVVPGGAWALAAYVRAALGDTLKFNALWDGYVSKISHDKDWWETNVLWSRKGSKYSVSAEVINDWTVLPVRSGLAISGTGVKKGSSFDCIDLRPVNNRELYDFKGGIVNTVIAATRDDSIQSSLSVDGEVTPSLCMLPKCACVKHAIRQVKLPQGAITAPELWKTLSPDDAKPLEAFFTIKEGSEPVSRLVLLLDEDWCLNPDESREHVGWVVFDSRRSDWFVWSSHAVFDWDVQSTSAKDQVSGSFLVSTRLKFDFGNDQKTAPGCLRMFPVPASFARQFQPNTRPASPVGNVAAVVTTVQLRPELGFFFEDESDGEGWVPRSSWLVSTGTPYRLMHPLGYWFPENEEWLSEAAKQIECDAKAVDANLAIDVGLRNSYEHGRIEPQWVPEEILEGSSYKHIAFIDLNLGFRQFNRLGDGKVSDAFLKSFQSDHEIAPEGPEGASETSTSAPDWWEPLRKWAAPAIRTPQNELANRGWIGAVLGREFPLSRKDPEKWDRNDIWGLLMDCEVDGSSTGKVPLFADKTILFLSCNLLRASGARISHRLSWEQTALDCVREIEGHERFRPLLNFRHIIVRVGCVGAVHISKFTSLAGEEVTEKRLLYDATARNGFHRDHATEGHVIGANSVFLASVFKRLLTSKHSSLSPVEENDLVASGISDGIVAAERLWDLGYGDQFSEKDSFRFDYWYPEKVLNGRPQ